jgi:outer membrane murein-binding lipoprotein Lpp
MNRTILTAILLCLPFTAGAADDLRVSQLEQEVRELQRQMRAQSQQIEQLRLQLARPVDQPRAASSPAPAAANDGLWLDAAKWQLVNTGMSELEVISLLGPPVSMRAEGSERVLLYAMEIGSSGFLTGTVTLRERVVLKVQVPVLR